MSFYDMVWKENEDIITKIEEMPFIQEMYSGVLTDERFFYYIEQDIHYLNDFARANAFLLARSVNNDMLKLFLDSVLGCFKEQENVHKKYTVLANFNATGHFTPAYENYRNFLLKHTSTSDLPIAYASTIPCPWLYVHLGKKFSEKEFVNNKYEYWFIANCLPEVEEFLNKQLRVLDKFAKDYPACQNDMKHVFRQALFLEYSFWNDAYNLTTTK